MRPWNATDRNSVIEAKLQRLVTAVDGAIDRLSRRKLLACGFVGLVALGLRLVELPSWPIPRPVVEDEFSYILQGETFALGRVTNPVHPLRQFFETIHVNQQPTYASKYPPGQGVVLALGIRLFGHPWFGVWLTVGLMCACICWMVQGWLPPRYGVFAGLAAALQFCNGYWMNSYWGGALAATGGALVLGALPRLRRWPRMGVATAGAIGILVLLSTRPFEGAVLVGACLVALVWTARRASLRELLRPRVFGGALAVLTAGAALMAYYNWRVAGSPFELPYLIHQRQYALAPVFWIERPLANAVHSYRDAAMRNLWVWDDSLYWQARRDPLVVVRSFAIAGATAFLLGPMVPLVAFSVLGVVVARRSPRLRPALVIAIFFVAVVLLEKFILAHYLAPAVALLFLVTAVGLRALRVARRTQGGPGRIAPLVAVAVSALIWLTDDRRPAPPPASIRARERAEAALSRLPGKHVVLVRYEQEHDPHDEVIYNGPAIDRQKVIWAIDRGHVEDALLERYYADRRVWTLDPDAPNADLYPY